jgi:hypothetical protein
MLVFAVFMPASKSPACAANHVAHLSCDTGSSAIFDPFIMYDFTLACFERALQLADDQTSADVWCGPDSGC